MVFDKGMHELSFRILKALYFVKYNWPTEIMQDL
jgi:hypothetical protein